MEIKWLVFTRRIVETLTGSGLVSHLLVSFLPTLGVRVRGVFFLHITKPRVELCGDIKTLRSKTRAWKI